MPQSSFSGFVHPRRKMLAAFILAPALLIGTLALIFRGGFRDIPVAVVNDDPGVEIPLMGFVSMPEKILAGLEGKAVRLIKTNLAGAQALAERGEARAILHFPSNLTRELMARMENPASALSTKIEFRLDRTAFLTSMVLQQKIMGAFLALAKEQSGESPMPIDMDKPLYGGEIGGVEYLMPGLLAILLFILAGIFSLSLARGLEGGERALHGMLAVFFASLVQTTLLASMLIPLFEMQIAGHWALAILLYALLSACAAAIGTFLGLLGRGNKPNPAPAFFILPLFFSGALLPLDLLPNWLRPLKYLLPPFYAATPARELLYRGGGFSGHAIDFAVLAAITCVFALAALRLDKRRAA
jgi:ABC-type multidrug transport system permease subunit